MMTRALIGLLLLTPLATADGIHVDVPLFDEDENCQHAAWSDSHYEDTEHGSSYTQADASTSECQRSQATTGAAVSDEDGEIVGARRGQGRETSSDHAGTSQSSGSADTATTMTESGHHATSESRDGAHVNAIGHDAHIGSICSTESAESTVGRTHDASFPGAPASHSENFDGDQAHTNSCEYGAHTSVDGRDVFLGAATRCGQDQQWNHATWRQEGSEGSAYHEHSSNDCRLGPEARLGPHAARATHREACENENANFRQGEEGESHTDTYSSGACHEGVLIEGPDGIALSIGQENRHAGGCTGEECWEERAEYVAISTAWANAPLGLGNHRLNLSPPTLP